MCVCWRMCVLMYGSVRGCVCVSINDDVCVVCEAVYVFVCLCKCMFGFVSLLPGFSDKRDCTVCCFLIPLSLSLSLSLSVSLSLSLSVSLSVSLSLCLSLSVSLC